MIPNSMARVDNFTRLPFASLHLFLSGVSEKKSCFINDRAFRFFASRIILEFDVFPMKKRSFDARREFIANAFDLDVWFCAIY